MTSVLESIGFVFIRLFEQTGLWFRMLWRTIVWGVRPPFDITEWFRQMVRVGVESVPVVFLTTMFTGMVFALETYCPASDGVSAARLEEEVVVVDGGIEIITKFPSKELFVTNPY